MVVSIVHVMAATVSIAQSTDCLSFPKMAISTLGYGVMGNFTDLSDKKRSPVVYFSQLRWRIEGVDR